MGNKFGIVFIFGLIFISCNFFSKRPKEYFDFETPLGFAMPDVPSDNIMTKARVDLGKKLFYDPILSKNHDISCASCHKPQFAFADTVAISKGSSSSMGTRNTPSLINVVYAPYFLSEGGVKSLEEVVVVPLHGETEMNLNMRESIKRLQADKTYLDLFQEAYDTLPSTYTLSRALACFQRTLISAASPFDLLQRVDSSAMSVESKRGMKLFNSDRLKCSHCHFGTGFTDFGFYNIGLVDSGGDPGRFRITGLPEDFGKFKTPSLRNVALTAPYMHDGSIKTLEEVIELYNQGGKNNPNKDERINALNLTEREKADLIAFLKDLTDSNIKKNPRFVP